MVRRLVAIPILLLVAMAGFLVWQILAETQAQRQLDHSDQISAEVQELQSLFIDQETGVRGFQLTGDAAMLAPWTSAATPIQRHFTILHSMLGDSPAQMAALEDVERHYREWETFAHAVLAKAPATPASKELDLRGKTLMDGLRSATGKMLEREGERRRTEYEHTERLQGRELISLLVSVLLIGMILAIFIRSRLRAISSSYLRRIAEVTRQSEELYESRQWFRTTLESIGDAVVACDVRGGVTFMNAVAEKLTGWKLDEAMGHPIEEVFHIVHEETRQAAENPVEKVRRMGQVVGMANHTVLIARNGREFAIDDSAAPIASGTGAMIGVVLVFRDVTEERQIQGALVASEKLAVAGRLAASIAHEIHNPLDSVANLHFLLAEESDPEKRAGYLRLAQQELGRTMQISRTMLSLYREPKAPVSLDLRELIEGVLLLTERRMHNLGIRVETDLAGAPMIEGFPAELRQVFTNLIGNAIDAAGPKGRIRIRMQAREAEEFRGAGAVVEIADSGPGIPVDIAPKLFQPFFTTKGASGTGLGLWVSMGIVQKHGGSIRAMNSTEPDVPGACMRVFLPVRTLAGAHLRSGR